MCERNKRVIREADLEPSNQAMDGALLCYNALAAHALADNKILWHMTPKFHMAGHIAYDFAQIRNPRWVHNYMDEDMVGKIKRISSKCHGLTAGKMALNRYIILVGVRWWRRLSTLRGIQ